MKDVTWRLGPAAILALANSIHGPGGHHRRRARPGDPGHDHLGSGDDAVAFLDRPEFPRPDGLPTGAQLARLRQIRGMARQLHHLPDDALGDWSRSLDAVLDGVTFRLAQDGTLASTATGWDGLADDLLPATRTLAADRARIRSCGNPLCGWLFVDRSRNASRVWCDMKACGNRMKVGRHRRSARALVQGAMDQPPR
jgi:CGNR zinc finger